MDVNPVGPPVKGTSVVAEVCALFGHQCPRKLFDVVSYKIVFIVKDEGFEQLYQLAYLFQISFGVRQGSFFKGSGAMILWIDFTMAIWAGADKRL